MPALHKIIGETFVPKAGDEKRFFEKHVVTVFKNIYSTEEYDKLFKATNIGVVKRKEERHGYSSGEDEAVYEARTTPRDTSDASAKNLSGKGKPIDPKKDPIRNLEIIKANTKRAKAAAKYLGLGEDEVELQENDHDLHNLADGAHHYLKRNKCDHKLGHVMHALMHTANDSELPVYTIKDMVGAHKYPMMPPAGDNKRHIVGGSGPHAGKTELERYNSVNKLFKAHLADAKKNDKHFDPSSLNEEQAEILSTFDEALQEEFNSLTESHRVMDHVNALKDTAKHLAIPLAATAGMLAVAHANGGASFAAGAAVGHVGVMAATGVHKDIANIYHGHLEKAKEDREYKGQTVAHRKVHPKSAIARAMMKFSRVRKESKESKFTSEYLEKLEEAKLAFETDNSE